MKNKKEGFLPFATAYGDYPNIIFLRMVSESENWYEVEVNEETRDTKFVLKNDPMWAKTSWSYWLYESVQLVINERKTLIYDKPDGKVLSRLNKAEVMYVRFLKAEGDWAYIDGDVSQEVKGSWIRWRKGRNILVGSAFNGWKIPDIKEDDN